MENGQLCLESNLGVGIRTTRILIVEEHPVIREALTILIGQEQDLQVCGVTGDAAALLEDIQRTEPSVVILGLAFKGPQALDVVLRIKQRFADIHIVVASMRSEPLFAKRALRAGASGFLHREELVEHLLQAIRRVSVGDVFLSDRMTNCVLRQAIIGEVPQRDPVEKLSRRQLEIFELIGQGHSVRQIANRLKLSPKTVEGHREMVKTKLGLKTGNELNRLAYRWMMEGSES